MKIDEVITGLIGMVLGMCIIMGVVSVKWEHHNTIVKQGCGQYNTQTDDFEWIKKESNNE